jgi:hypothetical protein
MIAQDPVDARVAAYAVRAGGVHHLRAAVRAATEAGHPVVVTVWIVGHEPEALTTTRRPITQVGAHAVLHADDVVPLVRGIELDVAGLAGLAGVAAPAAVVAGAAAVTEERAEGLLFVEGPLPPSADIRGRDPAKDASSSAAG